MSEIRTEILDWTQARERARAVRYAVFCVEQGIPVELEWDDRDESAVHCLAYASGDDCIGTGRLLPDGHIGRMAVLAQGRSGGIGGAILEALVVEARRRGFKVVALNAQTTALRFYQRHDFEAHGAPHFEAGIEHQAMQRKL